MVKGDAQDFTNWDEYLNINRTQYKIKMEETKEMISLSEGFMYAGYLIAMSIYIWDV